METSYSKYQLWSPPTLDLSLDSFSNDLIQEFDKKRTHIETESKENMVITNDNVDNEVKLQNEPIIQEKAEETKEPSELEEPSVPLVNDSHQPDKTASPVPSSTTLPTPSEHASSVCEEDSTLTTNLFRKSSTFLRKKLSQSSKKEDHDGSISTASAEEITNIVSRQYPPKPLQYSPVIESTSDHVDYTPSQTETNSTHSREVDNTSRSVSNRNSRSNRISDPISSTSTMSAVIPGAKVQSAQPKRRSFFSLRFC